MVDSNARQAQLVSPLVRNVTLILIVMMVRMKVPTSVAHRVHSRQTAVDGRKRCRITSIGQDSMGVQLRVELAQMHLATLQV